ncbi:MULTISPECIES: H-type small acid-soluble spore protein [Aneurinibacillus]|jgi:small acid-soluble spore protein H (minor)|uniref:Small, acid-soluble spore protein H n=1 Tax=Aneurinibacillus danicus TaxID=267746 RepID=A0A511VBW8_9BACL|nr:MULTISPECIES: H-type small acid-soluble spore protein [Aneurinibacillus]GEN36319.1 small, acid-soluble spore protein H [Aneurinibacillus danicus]
METKRAQEILQSPEKIDVGFEGVPVWIDSVDEQSKTARVHTMDNPTERKTVALSELKELEHH